MKENRKGTIMQSKRNKRIISVLVVLTFIVSHFLVGFTYKDNIYSEYISELFKDTKYYEQLGGHNTLGVERSFFTTSDLSNSGLQPYVFAGEITGKYTLTNMIKYIEEQGYKVVSGINGDLYDTASGASKGLTIHEGLIKSSGYAPEYVLSFDKKGSASVSFTNLQYSIKGTMNVPTTTKAAVDGVTDSSIAPKDEVVYVPQPYEKTIGFVNIPHGAGKALHLYNRQYSSSTKSTQNCVEIVIDTAGVNEAQPQIGKTITGTVSGGKTFTKNTPIKDNQIILSAAMDSPYAAELAQLAQGSTVEITVSNSGSASLNDSVEAMGVYYVLYENGKYITTGTNVNPRTCVGIKPDGSTMMLALDGRQSGWSAGLGLTETAEYLVSMGCTTVVNMDGGGSTTLATRLPGKETTATVKNSPSGGSQRAVANGLFFVYKGSGNKQVENLHTYVGNSLAMPGAEVKLATFASDNKYEPVTLQGGVTYTVENENGTVSSNGVFTAGKTPGKSVIIAENNGKTTKSTVEIFDGITLNTNEQKLFVDPGKTADINVNAYKGYAPVASKDSLFTFKCDEKIGTIDANGVFTARNQSGLSGNIVVSYKDKSKTIPVQVGSALVEFDDTKTHWAKDYIGKLASRGIVNGMGDNKYLPENTLTRAQFLTMLAKIDYSVDVTKSPAAGFTDVASAEWYYNYVNWGFANGIVNGIDAKTFAPNASITREQMAIMLVNFANSEKLTLPNTVTGVTFTDDATINSWAKEAVNMVVAAGIIGGYPEGHFGPQGNATRAQAAKVIYMYCDIKDSVAAKQNNK